MEEQRQEEQEEVVARRINSAGDGGAVGRGRRGHTQTKSFPARMRLHNAPCMSVLRVVCVCHHHHETDKKLIR